MLSHYFDIHPWDVERLSYLEIDAYVQALQDIGRRQREAESEARRHRR